MTLHGRVERAFQVLAASVCRNRIAVLLGAGVLTAVCGAWIPSMRFDNSTQGFLHRDDPARVAYDDFRAQFGQDEFVLVAVRAPNLFDLAFLERLRDLHRDLEARVPHLEDVTSMINARVTFGRDDALVVEDLFERWPQSPEELAPIRARALADPLYRNLLFSRNFTHTTITVRPVVYSEERSGDVLDGFDSEDPGPGDPLSDREVTEFLSAIRSVLARYESPTFEIQIAGSSVTNEDLNRALERDMVMFVAGAVLVMGIILGVLFRSWCGIVLPLVVVLMSLVSTLGIMVMLDIPASVALQLVPILLLAAGICDSVHILTIVNQNLARGVELDRAIAFALGHSGLAVLMTSVTTSAGFLSFASAELAPVAHLGRVAPIGIMLAFVYTVTLLPALVSLTGPRVVRTDSREGLERELGRVLARAGGVAARHPWSVLGGAVALSLAGLTGLLRLEVSQHALEWFPSRDASREAQELLDREFGGTTTLEIVVDSGEPGGLYDPALMARLEEATEFAARYEHDHIRAGKVLSILDVLRATHQALSENRVEMYRVPDSRELIAQELLLFENAGADDLEELVDTRFQVTRISVRVPAADAIDYQEYVRGMQEGLRDILGDDVGIETTGIMRLLTRSMAAVVYSMIRSYVTALLVITPLMVLLIGAWRQGLLAMIPNLLPVFLTLGLMGWMRIPIDMSSMLVGGIIIGLAVDDTIHFMHKYRDYITRLGNPVAAIHAALETTGAALLFTTLILGGGFVVMEFAYMRNASQFGQLACFATVAAFAADVLLAPALLVLIDRKRVLPAPPEKSSPDGPSPATRLH